ncbi:hypothetical protein OG978_01180 [Streptomyces sp. NBC_01591]|uniref:hypothetical protein n=1 Tax=Streptomyces sp. NBC_01591 TaxID=2975888 RepID=UPI002DD83C43|nr:hypothetical protein [Streptomyces sp. NBC_01591]WSD66172.1 hypothetical protein OG978_01180 [Streptomyces sp. NBC_01591]
MDTLSTESPAGPGLRDQMVSVIEARALMTVTGEDAAGVVRAVRTVLVDLGEHDIVDVVAVAPTPPRPSWTRCGPGSTRNGGPGPGIPKRLSATSTAYSLAVPSPYSSSTTPTSGAPRPWKLSAGSGRPRAGLVFRWS